MPFTRAYTIFTDIAVCVLVIQFIVCLTIGPHKTVQKVDFMLWILQVACSAHVCGIISGQYKDGTDGTRDFRMVSASFLILRKRY